MEYQVWPGRVVVNRAPISKGPSKSNFAGGSFQLEISVLNRHADCLGALHSTEYSNSQTGPFMPCVISFLYLTCRPSSCNARPQAISSLSMLRGLAVSC